MLVSDNFYSLASDRPVKEILKITNYVMLPDVLFW